MKKEKAKERISMDDLDLRLYTKILNHEMAIIEREIKQSRELLEKHKNMKG